MPILDHHRAIVSRETTKSIARGLQIQGLSCTIIQAGFLDCYVQFDVSQDRPDDQSIPPMWVDASALDEIPAPRG